MNKSNSKKNNIYVGKIHTSKKSIDIRGAGDRYYRADLVFDEVDHAVPSYEGRVFLNNADAKYETPKTLDKGYVGSYYIFGPGPCIGDEGHCETNKKPQKFRIFPDHPRARVSIIITDKLKELAKKTKEFSVTVVPVMSSYNPYDKEFDRDDVISFEKVAIHTYAKEE